MINVNKETRLTLLPVAALIPTEHVRPRHVARLLKTIRHTAMWTAPICIERNSKLVMDGHHRLAVARRLGLKQVPCYLFDYREVRVKGCRAAYPVSPDIILARARQGWVYPPKTTRHRFPALNEVAVPLTALATEGATYD